MTGRIRAEDPAGGKIVVYLRQGRPVYVERSDAADRLGHLLIEEGLVEATDVAEALERHKTTGRKLGETLCEMGFVDAATLEKVLRLQITRKLTRVFTVSLQACDFADGEHPFGRDGADAAVDARSLVYPGIRASYDEPRLVRELTPLRGKQVHLKPVSPRVLKEAGFQPQDNPLLMLLAGSGIRIDDKWLISVGPRTREAKAAVLALHYTDLLDVFMQEQTNTRGYTDVIGERRRPTPVAGTPTQDVTRTAMGTTPRHQGTIIGTPRPDFAVGAMPSAENTSTGRKSSAEWGALSAPQAIKMGEGYFAHGDVGRAERLFRTALESEPADARCLAFVTWIALSRSGTSPGSTLHEAQKIFQEALSKQPEFAYGHYFMGEVFQRQNQNEAAERSFRTALELQPQMFEAERQLRLMAMRKRGATAGRAVARI